MTAERLNHIHDWIQQAKHLSFVPTVVRTDRGGTVHVEGSRVWDLTRWMPGEPLLNGTHDRALLEKASAALAALHRAWQPPKRSLAPMPAVIRRLRILDEWNATTPRVEFDWLQRGVNAAVRLLEPARRALRPWLAHPLPIQPCLCDIHREHMLFVRGEVTGILDYGAAKEDHVAVDLARLLGDAVEDDDPRFQQGVNAYLAAGGILDVPSTFIRLLDRTGIICAMLGWAQRLGDAQIKTADAGAVQHRVARLTARLERISEF